MHRGYKETTRDICDITDILNIPRHVYTQTLLKEFDGELSVAFNVYFDSQEKCQKACDWLNSYIVLDKLAQEA